MSYLAKVEMSYLKRPIMPFFKGGVMAGKDRVTMSQKELRRLHFVRNALGKVITQAEAAEGMGISERQVRRIAERVREEGDRGLIHRSRGRASNRAIPVQVKTPGSGSLSKEIS